MVELDRTSKGRRSLEVVHPGLEGYFCFPNMYNAVEFSLYMFYVNLTKVQLLKQKFNM